MIFCAVSVWCLLSKSKHLTGPPLTKVNLADLKIQVTTNHCRVLNKSVASSRVARVMRWEAVVIHRNVLQIFIASSEIQCLTVLFSCGQDHCERTNDIVVSIFKMQTKSAFRHSCNLATVEGL